MPDHVEKSCFVIAPIGDPESDTRKRSDQVLRHIIRPAVESIGYTAVRADEIDRPGIITSQVIGHVVGDPLVVADLTERNPNVFYELAIRHALRKPLVQLIEKGERIPFDVAATRTIYVDHRDLDSVETAKAEMVAQVTALEGSGDSDLETPISVSLDLQRLKQSEDPEERSLADILAAVTEMRDVVSILGNRINVERSHAVSVEDKQALQDILEQLKLRGNRATHRPVAMVHPSMLHEAVRFASPNSDDPIGVLIVASMFRNTFPWLYEMGLEAYRNIQRGRGTKAQDSFNRFARMIEFTLESPLADDFDAPQELKRFARDWVFILDDLGRRLFAAS